MTETGGHSTLSVDVPGRASARYDVRIEQGGFAHLGRLCMEGMPAHGYAVIADSKVARLHGERAVKLIEDAGGHATLFSFPAGQWNKTRDEWASLSDQMLLAGIGRDGAVIALGGGVTGDLAGFVAATYMRGLPLAQVPTTLLAMLDSSVGGKTGIDTLDAKNSVGAFHHPRFVLIDPELLGTLPRFQLVAGLAEAVKAAAIADADLFDWIADAPDALVSADPERTPELIARAIQIKIDVVQEDPEEGARREILNFGHTLGHALEVLCGYSVLHGEAIAAGMRLEAALGEIAGVTEKGAADRLTELLRELELDQPIEEDFEAPAILEVAKADKKARAGVPRCVLLERIGTVARADDGGHAHHLPDEVALDWLRAALRPR